LERFIYVLDLNGDHQMIRLSRFSPVIFGFIVFVVAIALAHAQEELPACQRNTDVGPGIALAHAQEEFPPPQGKGRVVVVDSGHDGIPHNRSVAGQLAQLGYDVVLTDANQIRGPGGPWNSDEVVALRAAIEQAQHMPHALPGKVALVGFSQGGGQVLFFGSRIDDLVSVVIAWYPATTGLDISSFVSQLRVPVLMFAGEEDYTNNCCLIGTARSLATATAGRQFQLVTYPNTKHDFIHGGYNYNPQAYTDAMKRTAAELARYLGQ
jgi:dienelactone hydrolase